MDPEKRDEVISEISNLVDRRMVTTALSGELQGVLELHIRYINFSPFKYIHVKNFIILLFYQERADRVSSRQGFDSIMQSLQRQNTYHREASHGREGHCEDQETYSRLCNDIYTKEYPK